MVATELAATELAVTKLAAAKLAATKLTATKLAATKLTATKLALTESAAAKVARLFEVPNTREPLIRSSKYERVSSFEAPNAKTDSPVAHSLSISLALSHSLSTSSLSHPPSRARRFPHTHQSRAHNRAHTRRLAPALREGEVAGIRKAAAASTRGREGDISPALPSLRGTLRPLATSLPRSLPLSASLRPPAHHKSRIIARSVARHTHRHTETRRRRALPLYPFAQAKRTLYSAPVSPVTSGLFRPLLFWSPLF